MDTALRMIGRWLAGLVLVVACFAARSQPYVVSIATDPFAPNVWVNCDTLAELDAIVTSADPTVHQVKVCVASDAAAKAIPDQMLVDWYQAGLNVVFGIIGPGGGAAPGGPGIGGPQFQLLLARAHHFETQLTQHAVQTRVVRGFAPPQRRPAPHPASGMIGPIGAFGSPSGLQGFEVNMPGSAPAMPFVVTRMKLVPFPTLRAPEPAIFPLPAGTAGIMDIMLSYLYDFDATGRKPLPHLGAGATRYLPSMRVFHARGMFIYAVNQLLEAGVARIAMPAAPALPQPAPAAPAVVLVVPARLSALLRLKLLQYMSIGTFDSDSADDSANLPKPPPPPPPGMGSVMDR